MATDGRTVLERNKAVVRRLYEEAVGRHDLAVLDEIVSEDVDDWHAAPGDAGLAGFRRHVAAIHDRFGDLAVTVDDLVAEGDRVVAFWTQSGVHRAPAFAERFPGTGKRFTISVVSVLRLAGGRIVQYRARPDKFAFAQQIGLLPPPPAPGTG